MDAKICSLDGGAPLFIMKDHQGPVLSIAVCPYMKYASTASGDGILRIYDIDTQKIIKEIPCVPKINTFYAAKALCKFLIEVFVVFKLYIMQDHQCDTILPITIVIM